MGRSEPAYGGSQLEVIAYSKTRRLWKMGLLLLVLVGMSCMGFSSAYSNGSVSSVCVSMLPGHDNAAQTTAPLYQVRVNSTSYRPGDSIMVMLEAVDSGTGFRGFMLQARRTANGAAVGSFSSANTSLFRLHDCFSGMNSTISHASDRNKTNFEATWVAPLTSSPGNIEFCATFVKNYSHFWTMVRSPIVTSASSVVSLSAQVTGFCVLTALAVIFSSVP
ncbi:putative ferric-chelate reductase 1 [Salminus brasiliensis]|uniref:putative ferric-chelate reductase 1 n=1 Tax=Salminus brasiliensis TaxID=930266 RepID=UPI003B834C1B